MITRLYEKNETAFAFLWIAVYVLASGAGNELSRAAGPAGSAAAPLHAGLLLLLILWIRKNSLQNRYGLCRPRIPARRMLFYIPLIVCASGAMWSGFPAPGRGAAGSGWFAADMAAVGCLEEILFRGLLLRALEKRGRRRAAIESAAVFALCHGIGILSGSRDPAAGIAQILLAGTAGFTLAMVFFRSGSLLPGIAFHAVNNVLTVLIAGGGAETGEQALIPAGVMIVLLGGYGAYLCGKEP